MTHGNHWKGGRTISHGYVRVWVGPDHHLASSGGYAYEHRVVAEEKLGRRLTPGEEIHHVNGDRTDNRPENIEVHPSRLHHLVNHRRPGAIERRKPGEENPEIACACGCGTTFPKYAPRGYARRYVFGHAWRARWGDPPR